MTVLLLASMLVAVAAPGTSQRLFKTGSGVSGGTWAPSTEVVTGYLTWTGTGGIAWNEAAPTADPGGPAAEDATQAKAKAVVGGQVRNVAGGRSPFATGPDVFTSEKVASAIYLNVSRHINLKLYFEGACTNDYDPRLDVELRVGSKFLAGGMSWHKRYDTSPPSGWCVEDYFLAPELDRLAEAEILSITIIHVDQQGAVRYGLAGNHRSRIILPVYTADEAVARVSNLPGQNPGFGGAASAAPLVLFLVPGRRRGRAGPWILLPAAGLLAGCAQSPQLIDPEAEAATTRPVESRQIEIDPVDAGGVGLGALAGEVLDEFGTPLEETRVSIRGTSNHTDTDALGKFRFAGLRPDRYRVHFERDGFESQETAQAVAANNLTWIRITLVALQPITRNDRPHPHDDWGKDKVKVWDFELPEATDGVNRWTIPAGERVLPGTEDIEVTLMWQDTAGYPRLGLQFQDNPHDRGSPSVGNGGGPLLYPRAPNEPFHIRTNQETTDPGHQKFSTWGFFVTFPHDTDRRGLVADNVDFAQATAFPGTLKVHMVLHKGVVTPGPAHLDVWDGQTAKVLFQDQTISIQSQCRIGPNPVPFVPYPLPEAAGQCTRPFNTTFSPPAMVPPETVWLEVLLDQTRAMTPQTPGWILSYKGADSPPSCSKVTPVRPAGAPWKQDVAAHKWEYRFPIGEKEPDPFYAKRTSWCFTIEPTDQEATGRDHLINYKVQTYAGNQLAVLISVVAHRDPMPTA